MKKKKIIDLSKLFITYELANKMYEIGFDEPCLATIDQTDYIHIKGTKQPIRGAMFYHEINLPTYDQAFTWFRDKHQIISVIDFYNNNCEEWDETEYKVTISEFKHFSTHDTFVKSGILNYNKAQTVCLDTLIKIISEDFKPEDYEG